MVRQAVRQAHGPAQSRRTHHPEPGRRANSNDLTRTSRNQTISITKARNDESTKRSQENFRVFQLSCFRDKKSFFIKCKEFTTKTLNLALININSVPKIDSFLELMTRSVLNIIRQFCTFHLVPVDPLIR